METIYVKNKRQLADLITPVGLYLKIRDLSYHPFLLESSDYHGETDSYSFICFQPLAEVQVQNGRLRTWYQNKQTQDYYPGNIPDAVYAFMQSFQIEGDPLHHLNGFFGYFAFDSVRYFENIELSEEAEVPEIQFTLFRNIIAINHYRNETTLIENLPKGAGSQMDFLSDLLTNKNFTPFPFETNGAIQSNLSDTDYEGMVKKAREHCQRGDVYQMVLSRRYEQPFLGDEFNVYRALRSVNPSPYLFYFDYGQLKIFGSSPESQVQINGREAVIHPIAGTFRRTGKDREDEKAALELKEDPKENAEHVMLVDLARNDLSRSCTNVQVETFKELQFFSHVIHMVSKVTGQLPENANPLKVLGDNFPAGTLSGAPKYRAMELIRDYEPDNRGVYGGCIGKIGLDGSANLAITIRTFMSRKNKLFLQAGAGIVNQSDEKKERQEVENKLMALRKAIEMAEKISES